MPVFLAQEMQLSNVCFMRFKPVVHALSKVPVYVRFRCLFDVSLTFIAMSSVDRPIMQEMGSGQLPYTILCSSGDGMIDD